MAAGSSTRFGSDKRRYNDGSGTLLQRTLRHVLALELPTRVALRAQDQNDTAELLGAAAAQVTPHYMPAPERGLGHSIACCFQTPPPWDGALIFLGDMPDITQETGRILLQHFQPDRIQAPTYRRRRGHPVLFANRFFNALANLEGDSGAQALLLGESASVDLHVVNDPGVLQDIDTPPDSKQHS